MLQDDDIIFQNSFDAQVRFKVQFFFYRNIRAKAQLMKNFDTTSQLEC